MSDRRPLICKECSERRELQGTFESRTELGIKVLGICDVCYEIETCVHVTPQEAMSLARSERIIIKSILAGLGIAALLIAAYFFAVEECRSAGLSLRHCMMKKIVR